MQAYDKLVAESVSDMEMDDGMPRLELPPVSIEDIKAELELIDFPEPENDPFADRPGFLAALLKDISVRTQIPPKPRTKY